MNTRSKSLARAAALCVTALFASALLLSATPAAAAKVGYYDLFTGQGEDYQVAPIVTAGHTAVRLTTLSSTELASIDVLFALNPDNSAYGAEYLGALATIEAAVRNGLVLILADRHVASAAKILPGGAGITFRRDFTNHANIDIADDTTLLTNGPGGRITNTNLDGGNSSNHGFAEVATLPAGNRVILISAPGQTVTFSYPYGSGAVVYSTVPLDAYLAGGIFGSPETSANIKNIYGPNLIAYSALLAGGSSLGPIVLRYCHSAAHFGEAACTKVVNGQELSTTGNVASQAAVQTACATGEPTRGTANVRVTAGDFVTVNWTDLNCGANDGNRSIQVNTTMVNSVGADVELKAEHANGASVRLRVIPPDTRDPAFNEKLKPFKTIVIDSANESFARKFIIIGDERLVLHFTAAVPDDVITSAAVKFQVGSKKYFPPQTIIVEAYHNGTLVGQEGRTLSGDERTGFSELQVYTPGNFGNKPFDKLVFKPAAGSAFGLGPLDVNTTRPIGP